MLRSWIILWNKCRDVDDHAVEHNSDVGRFQENDRVIDSDRLVLMYPTYPIYASSVLAIVLTDRRGERLSPRLRRRARRYVPLGSITPSRDPHQRPRGLPQPHHHAENHFLGPQPHPHAEIHQKFQTTHQLFLLTHHCYFFNASMPQTRRVRRQVGPCYPHTIPRRRTGSPGSIRGCFERSILSHPRRPRRRNQ